VRTVCEPIFDRPLADISFGQILLRLFEISRRFNMQIQPQLILLQKTLLNVEGLGRDLYPQLDVWRTASPILREWMRERASPRQVLKTLRQQAPELMEAFRALPSLVKTTVERARGGNLRMEVESQAIEALRAEVRRGNRRRDSIIVGAMLTLAGLVWLAISGAQDWPGWALSAGGAVWLLSAFRRRWD
jgi:ubiquinone biosynthesis protein